MADWRTRLRRDLERFQRELDISGTVPVNVLDAYDVTRKTQIPEDVLAKVILDEYITQGSTSDYWEQPIEEIRL